MKFLIIDTDRSIDLVKQLSKEGHEVFYFTSDSEYGSGLIDDPSVIRVDDFYSVIEDVDILLFTDIGYGEDVSFLKDHGYDVFGPCLDSEKLKTDILFGRQIAKDSGLQVPQTFEMTAEEAVDFMVNKNEPYVIRHDDLVYVPVNFEDCLWYIEELSGSEIIILEEIIDGIDVGISSFFNGTEFLDPCLINFEYKRLMDGDVGHKTDGMGSAILYSSDDLPFIQYLKQMEDYLRKINFVGYFGICCLVNEDNYYVIGLKPRFRYPAILFQNLLSKETFASLIRKTVEGKQTKFLADTDKWAFGISLNKSEVTRIFGVDDAERDGLNISFDSIIKKDGYYFSTNLKDRVLVISGDGYNIQEVRDSSYEGLDYIYFKDMKYRLDIGLSIESSLQNLVEWGIVPDRMI